VSIDTTRISMEADPHTRILSGVTFHGLIPFSVPFISEIAPNLWQGGCTDGLILPRSFRHIVSLYPWESYKIKHELISSVSVRMLDGLDEDMGQVMALAGWVNACRKSGPVICHCQAGLNRSSLVVASALMLEGMTAGAAIALIREKRSPACLCNPAFEEWLWSQAGRQTRGWCAACERMFAVRLDGYLRRHRSPQGTCIGSGTRPDVGTPPGLLAASAVAS
jgi:protein-tyrosine phosphatase